MPEAVRDPVSIIREWETERMLKLVAFLTALAVLLRVNREIL